MEHYKLDKFIVNMFETVGIDKDTFSEYMSNHNITDQHGYKLSDDKKDVIKLYFGQ